MGVTHTGAVLSGTARTVNPIRSVQPPRYQAASRGSPTAPSRSDPDTLLIYASAEMRRLVHLAIRAAPSDLPVLITGETGTGKEVLARLIHRASGRPRDLFEPFNCTSLPAELVEAQLFGHRRGSFTGAHRHAAGIVRAVDGGTLLLDEIGDLDLRAQPKLLRLIDRNEIHPVGQSRPTIVNVRILAVTNADVAQLVAEKRFRKDLFYRLNIIHLHVPPLRDRPTDIPPLARHFLGLYAVRYGKENLQISGGAMEMLMRQHWPGNVRQLANELRRLAVLFGRGGVIRPGHLPFAPADAASAAEAADRPEAAAELPTETMTLSTDQPLADAVAQVERAVIRRALQLADGHREAAARRLGISRRALLTRRRRLKLDPLP